MSADSNVPDVVLQHPESSAKTYTIGFVLSLVLTTASFYLVANKTITGKLLLYIVALGALLQILVQVIFFLHAGQRSTRRLNMILFVLTMFISIVVILGSMFILDHLRYNMSPLNATKKLAQDEAIYQLEDRRTGACQTKGTNYKIILTNNKANPTSIKAKLCDTITFVNNDAMAHTITFGSYSNHSDYASVPEVTVRKGRNKTITLIVSGSFQYHDHSHTTLLGKFTVAPK